MPRPLVKHITGWVLWLALAYMTCVGCLFYFQRNIMYFPDPVPLDPARWAIGEVQPLDVTSDDAVKVRSWYAPAMGGNRVTVVFFQGNGGHLGLRNYKIRSWIDAGYGVLLVGYRGYGNPASPTEDGLYHDARATIDAAMIRGVPVEKMVFYGESLGTAIAIQMATEYRDVGGVILEAPFTSMVDVWRAHYPLLPVGMLLKDRYQSLSKISLVRSPLLLVHGTRDRLVPIAQGRKLFLEANEPKQGIFVEGGAHMNLYGPDVQKQVLGFLAKRSGF